MSKIMINKYVTSLKYSKKLKDLGLKQNSLYKWRYCYKKNKNIILYEKKSIKNNYSAYLSEELLKLIPEKIYLKGKSSIIADIEKIVDFDFYIRKYNNNYFLTQYIGVSKLGCKKYIDFLYNSDFFDYKLSDSLARLIIYLKNNNIF